MFEVVQVPGSVPIKQWTRGVPVEAAARKQLANIASLPFIHSHVAVMPDVHFGIGATVGSVIPTVGAIVPAAVGVDLGCGMSAVQTTLTASQLPDSLSAIRSLIESKVPVGRAQHDDVDGETLRTWGNELEARYRRIIHNHAAIQQAESKRALRQLGTLGGGNHFVELCLDENDTVWVMLHSGSRGIGNRIGTHFIELAKRDMERDQVQLPDRDLAYLTEGSTVFDEYVDAVEWAQDYARHNRRLMMVAVIRALAFEAKLPPFTTTAQAVSCHHNYISREQHAGADVWLTRKGAVSARAGELGIIPGSMGAKSFIVRGKGNPESFCSCSHGAGRAMSRGEAKRRFTVADHEAATSGIECRKDEDVIDETPMAYKSIDAVMAAQADLVEVVHTLRQVVCVKG
jgi:tRNA-splicing ligase RtcB (3'-phosphate/5'-hydroxy nucleic acid ligase)